MKLMLAGGSGLVGREVLTRALAEPKIQTLVVPTRRPLAITHQKLLSPLVRFEDLPVAADWWQVDTVICALGTTIKKAGSREAFREIDHDYPLAVARLANAAGAARFVLVSAVGASPNSPFFYSRVKGELEDDLMALGFRSLTVVRPSVIGGERSERRLGEQLAAGALTILGPVLPRGWRINPASKIAQALLDAALDDRAGIRIVASAEMA